MCLFCGDTWSLLSCYWSWLCGCAPIHTAAGVMSSGAWAAAVLLWQFAHVNCASQSLYPTCTEASQGIPPEERTACPFLPSAWEDIDAGHCEALGCCFNDTSLAAVPSCFQVPLPDPPPGLLHNITNPNLRWLGFFGQPDLDGSSYQPADQVGFANFGCATDFPTLQRGAALGMSSFFRTQTFLVDDGGNSSTRVRGAERDAAWSGHRLFPDWRERWAALAAELGPWVANGTVSGLFIGDELCWGGLPFTDLVDMATAIANTTWPAPSNGMGPQSQRTSRPIVHYNEAKGAVVDDKDWQGNIVNFTHVPLGVDWVSFDFYNPPPGETVRQWYEASLYPKMATHQRVLLVPDASTSVHQR